MSNQYKGHIDQQFGHITYAQHGDDLMIMNLFKLFGIDKPSYLDIGAHHPFTISNTALLYAHGSCGVNVEANKLLIEEFEKHRPFDLNVCIGVSIKKDVVPFYKCGDTSGRNTISIAEVESLSGILNYQKTELISTTTINDIVNDYCAGIWPHFLSIDVEGVDYDILETADFESSKPILICVETRREKGEAMRQLLSRKGYYCYCRMGENLFFIDIPYISKAY